jgi:hypothetical protein
LDWEISIMNDHRILAPTVLLALCCACTFPFGVDGSWRAGEASEGTTPGAAPSTENGKTPPVAPVRAASVPTGPAPTTAPQPAGTASGVAAAPAGPPLPRPVVLEGVSFLRRTHERAPSGEALDEYIPAAETLDRWTTMLAVRRQPVAARPRDAARQMARRVRAAGHEHEVRAGRRPGEAVLDFLVQADGVLELNAFRFTRGPDGMLRSYQVARRVYGDERLPFARRLTAERRAIVEVVETFPFPALDASAPSGDAVASEAAAGPEGGAPSILVRGPTGSDRSAVCIRECEAEHGPLVDRRATERCVARRGGSPLECASRSLNPATNRCQRACRGI